MFKLNWLGWHWLIGLYRLQVYNTMMHDLYIILCAYHPRPNYLASPYTWPPLSFPSLHSSSPLVATTLLSVSMSFCWLVCFCPFVATGFISQGYHIILNFSVWLILLSMTFSRFIYTFANVFYHDRNGSTAPEKIWAEWHYLVLHMFKMISLTDSLKIDYREHVEEIRFKVIAIIQINK